MRRLWIWFRLLVRRLLGAAGTPEEVSRGMAAGAFVAAWPLPGLQVPLSLLLATLVRGNRLVSVLPQTVSNPITMLPLTLAQYKLGVLLMPGHRETHGVREQLGLLKEAASEFRWSEFRASMARFYATLSDMGWDVGMPILVGVAVSSVVAAVAGYFVVLFTIRAFHRRAERRRRAMGLDSEGFPIGRPATILVPTDLPPADPAGGTGVAAPKRETRRAAPETEDSQAPAAASDRGAPSASAGTDVRERPRAGAIERAVSLRVATALELSPECRAYAARFKVEPKRLIPGNRLRLLHDGREAFPAMLDAIAGAKRYVLFEAYLLESDEVGWRFHNALCERARAGVEVRMIYDAVGASALSEEYRHGLTRAGVRHVAYHPVAPWRKDWAINKRDHRKILVIDGSIGFTGGINISKQYTPPEEGGEGWRDTHVELRGPAVPALQDLFAETWRHCTGEALPYPGRLDGYEDGCAVQILGTRLFHDRHLIRSAYVRAIRHAQATVFIANAFFVPDRGVRRVLARAVARGVSVQVMVAENNTVAAVGYASRALYTGLLKAGIRVFHWPLGMLHSKTAVIDGVWSMVGSYNMNHRSLFHDLEDTALILDRRFGDEMIRIFTRDRELCREVTLDTWEKRPLKEKILEQVCHAVRYWL